MDYIQLLNMIVAMVFSVRFQYSLYKRRFNFLRAVFTNLQEKNKLELCDEISVKSEYMGEIMFLIIWEAILLTVGFVLLFIIQTSFADVAIFTSGIHIPVFFLFLGMVIRALYNHHTKKKRISPLAFKDIEKITLLISIIIDISLCLINWVLGLFVFSLIIGKVVWIDFALGTEGITGKIKALQSYLTQSDDWDVVFYCKEYAIHYLMLYGMFSIFCYYIKKFPIDSSMFLQMLFCGYFAVFMSYNSMIGAIDIGDGATKFALYKN